jgi:hypothetical protein
MISSRTWVVITAVLGVVLLVSLALTGVFGYQLANYSAAKAKEIQNDLDNQASQLKADFQSQLETNTATYTASEVFGSFQFSYPKVWSTNVTEADKESTALIFLADPNLIVQNKDEKGPFTALRVQVYSASYDSKVKDVRSQHITNVEKPYTETSVTVSGIDGKKYQGTDEDSGKNIAFVLVPLRDKTLYIGTDDAAKYLKSLDSIVKTFNISK